MQVHYIMTDGTIHLTKVVQEVLGANLSLEATSIVQIKNSFGVRWTQCSVWGSHSPGSIQWRIFSICVSQIHTQKREIHTQGNVSRGYIIINCINKRSTFQKAPADFLFPPNTFGRLRQGDAMTNQTASSDLGWEPDALISRPVSFPFDYASQVAICPQIAMSAKTTSNTLYSEFLITCFLNIPKWFALSLVNLCYQYPYHQKLFLVPF